VPASLASPAPTDKVYEWGKQVLQSPSAADRHNAIRQLVQYDWKQHPMVTSVLLAGAKTDPNNVVRVDCLRHLAAYKMAHPQVLSDLAAMADDADPWVRQEAAQALGQIKQVP
jgi:HEAT repeat protein